MKKNMSDDDRVRRSILAALITVMYLQGVVAGLWGIALLVIAGLLSVTGIAGYCPLYNLFRIKTSSKK